MSESARTADMFFNRSCPVCGRMLRIRVQLLGCRVYCQHCGGGFTAVDESLGQGPAVDDRVEDLIAQASRLLARTTADDGDEVGVSG